MPVWHELLKEWVDAGEIQVVGLIQEQHPERCRLFAQWKEFGWPILWDPFNLSGSRVVPNIVAVDEFGIVRALNPDPETFGETFLMRSFEETDVVLREASTKGGGMEPAAEQALGDLLWQKGSLSEGVDRLVENARRHPGNGAAQFRAGVALRRRYDSPEFRAEDFQQALDFWARALELDPNQYIWRRRIQQYGPRMDKPYNFYSWVGIATEQIKSRGEEPVELTVALTPAELAFPRRAFGPPDREEPDPDGRIDRDTEGWLQVESAVAFATKDERTTASIHLALRPNSDRDVHWNNEAGSMVLWVAKDMPDGWVLSERLVERLPGGDATSDEVRRYCVELELPAQRGSAVDLKGYVLFYACEGENGTCVYRRHDFSFPVDPSPEDAG